MQTTLKLYFSGPGWGEPPADASVAVMDLNAHLGPAGLQIKVVDMHGMALKQSGQQQGGAAAAAGGGAARGMYTLVNTRTDEAAAKSTRWELWEQKAFVQIYHTLRKP